MARRLRELGFELCATHGTAERLRAAGLTVRGLNKVNEGRPHCVDAMESGDINLVVNTTEGRQAIADSHSLRRAALLQQHLLLHHHAGGARGGRGDRRSRARGAPGRAAAELSFRDVTTTPRMRRHV